MTGKRFPGPFNGAVPADFLAKWKAFFLNVSSINIIPATRVIARTPMNEKNGGVTPVAGRNPHLI